MGISTNPETFTEGGLFDGVNVKVDKGTFVLFDYDGKVNPPRPCWRAELSPEEGDKSYPQHWGCGQAKDFIPSEDGKELNPVGKRQSLNSGCNFAMFCRSLIEAGIPADVVEQLGSDAGALDGYVFFVVQQVIPARKEGQNDTKVILVESAVSEPGDKKGKGKAKGEGKAKAKKDVAAETEAILVGILEEKGTVAKKQLPTLVFSKTKDKGVLDMAFDDDFLGAAERPWEFADGTLVMKG